MPIQNITPNQSAHPVTADVGRISVGGVDLERVTYNGETVVTLAQIDRAHGRAEGTARRNFNQNRKHFSTPGEYVVANLDEIRTGFPDAFPARGGGEVILLTRRGYMKLCKSLNDPKAWERFDDMLDVYFGVSPAPAIAYDPSDPAVLLAVMGSLQAQVAAKDQHIAELERTKAQIGNRREATAMATARNAKLEAEKLKIQLDQSTVYATAARMARIHGREFHFAPLKKASGALGLEVKKVHDDRWGSVNSYHALAWREAFGVEVPGWTGADQDGEAE